GLYQVTSADGIEFKNNIVYITRGGTGLKYGIYKSTAATPLVSNNNIFYLGSAGSGAQYIGYQTSAQASLTAWQTASSQDLNSMVADPLFTNPSVGDYKPTETSIDNKGASLGVLRDILDTIRPLILPDLGAYEFGTMPSPCSATPVPGNTVSSVPIACPNSNFTLSLEFPPSELGLTFQWQSADDAAFTTNVVDLGTASTQATSQTSAKYYRCKVTCTNSGLFAYSTPIFIDINSWINCYCTPATTGGTTYYISGFTTTGGSTNINKTTSAGSVSGYQDFYATDEVTINKGDVLAYTINVAGGSTYGYAIWIDFNQDGTFQATEQVLTTSSYASSPKTGTVTIPNTAVVGSTRVRVLATFSPSNPSDPCNNSGSGEYQDYAITIQQPVPVTYTMFTGKREGMVNMLSWQTATESNNIGFELQRSSDGKQFSKLSFVNSKAINGNSTSNLSYGYNDVKPLAGTNYYRLKQVDKDGKFNYSTVVILKGDKVSQISIASVYPNPVRNTINVQIVSPANEKVSLVITDITGKVLMQENTSLTAGDNVKQIDVSRLSQGAYLIKAICNNGCETAVFKFTKY
ncbi:MAG TPA: GEVED domain-containing protein, partial [Chitinophagaceae bacterium]|nr:GEVED domain-containing protein [Chitinophagaceae bacterium]